MVKDLTTIIEEEKECSRCISMRWIRTGCRVYGKNISEMARMTGHSRNTIKKAIRGEPWGYKERAHQRFPVLDKYLAVIDEWLKSGPRTSQRKQRHTARRIYNRLVENKDIKGASRQSDAMFGCEDVFGDRYFARIYSARPGGGI